MAGSAMERSVGARQSRHSASTVYVLSVFLAAAGLAGLFAADAATADKITLKDGKQLQGSLLDVTKKRVVIVVDKEKLRFDRAEVTDIQRAASKEQLALFEKKFESFKDAGTIDDWKGLATYCDKQKLYPEQRRAFREIVRLDPDDKPARLGLGHALLDGKWILEDQVEAKRKEGFQLVDGKLEKKAEPVENAKDGKGKDEKTGVTVVKKDKTPADTYRFLERKKMSTSERSKLEKERAARLKSADKYLAEKQKEYDGIPWAQRHIIKTRNFEIHCNSTRKVADAYGVMMEIIRGKLSEMFSSPIQRNLRAPVYIYSSQQEFMENDRLAKWMGRGLGGYYMPSNQSVTAFHGTFGFTGTTFGVLCHEGTHYYQGLVLKDFDNVPIWLIEGLAVYFGDGSIFDPNSAKITVGQIPRDRLAHLQEKMLLKRHSPVKTLVSMTRQSGFNGSHYADAWGLIYFLVKSGKKGERLLQEYWGIGLKRLLNKKDFLDLAEKHFGGVDAIEKEYVDYILKLEMPPAGKVLGDYYVSDIFQFDFRAPNEEWRFFEDKDDKKLLVGLLSPNGAGEVRVYYQNNELWKPTDEYMDGYVKALSNFKDLKREKVKSGKLEWERLTYTDDGSSRDMPTIMVSDDGEIEIVQKDEKRKKKTPRDVVRYVYVQVDGVVELECSTKKGEIAQFAEFFDKAYENFTICFTRRW